MRSLPTRSSSMGPSSAGRTPGDRLRNGRPPIRNEVGSPCQQGAPPSGWVWIVLALDDRLSADRLPRMALRLAPILLPLPLRSAPPFRLWTRKHPALTARWPMFSPAPLRVHRARFVPPRAHRAPHLRGQRPPYALYPSSGNRALHNKSPKRIQPPAHWRRRLYTNSCATGADSWV
jgi:hypothetical protein